MVVSLSLIVNRVESVENRALAAGEIHGRRRPDRDDVVHGDASVRSPAPTVPNLLSTTRTTASQTIAPGRDVLDEVGAPPVRPGELVKISIASEQLPTNNDCSIEI